MLDNIRISTKIIGSTIAVFLMFMLSEFFGYNNLNMVVDQANNAFAVQQMVVDILEARRHEKNLLLRHEARYRDEALKAIAQVREQAARVRDNFAQETSRKLMDDAIAAVGEYENAFRQVADQVLGGSATQESLQELDRRMVAAARQAIAACDAARADQQQAMKTTSESVTRAYTLFALLFLVIGGLASFVVIRGIIRSIKVVLDGTKEVSGGNLAIPPVPVGSTEMGRLGQAFNSMIDSIGATICNVTGSAAKVSVSATRIHLVADRISRTAEEVALQVRSVAEASTEMANGSAEISSNCQQASEGARQARASAEEGAAVVEQTIRLMGGIAETVQESARTVADLGERSNQIGAIIGTIKEIAEQTNLLALNAAIEAARAGEQGRGFAVVADEVRKLAERTSRSTHEISDMIGTIQQETGNAVRAMELGTQQVEAGSREAGRSGAALADILSQVSELAGRLEQIALASERQSASTEEISVSIQSITETIRSTANEAHQSALAASGMNGIAEELMGNIGAFRLAENAGLAISKAKSAHMIFIGKVKAHLDGAVRLDPDAMPSHTSCAFGQWYQSRGREIFGSNPLFMGIDNPHAQVHSLGRQAVQAAIAGDMTKAHALCTQMENTSMALVDMLDKLEASGISHL